jgi:signal peptidase I
MSETPEPVREPYSMPPEYVLTPQGAPAGVAAAEESQPSMGWMLLRELIETVVLSLVIFLLIRQVVQNYRIESHSMEPNFYEGQFILVNKLAYRLGEPARGDVIVFHNPDNPEEDYIKRVIGLPGDSVELHDQKVYINGEVLPEPFDQNVMSPGTVYGPIVVEPDHLFVMGDNRPNSRDSRGFGQLPEELIVGKAWVRVWPLHLFGPVQHYDLEPGAVVAGG